MPNPTEPATLTACEQPGCPYANPCPEHGKGLRSVYEKLRRGDVCPRHGSNARYVDRCSACEAHGAPVGFRIVSDER